MPESDHVHPQEAVHGVGVTTTVCNALRPAVTLQCKQFCCSMKRHTVHGRLMQDLADHIHADLHGKIGCSSGPPHAAAAAVECSGAHCPLVLQCYAHLLWCFPIQLEGALTHLFVSQPTCCNLSRQIVTFECARWTCVSLKDGL